MGNAAKHKQLPIVEYLATQSPVKEAIKQDHLRGKYKSFEMICQAVKGGSVECVSVPLELNGNLVHLREPHHIMTTALLRAVHLKLAESLPMVKLLLSYGADPNAKAVMNDPSGLQSAEVFKTLQDAGGRTNLFEDSIFGRNMINEQSICLAAHSGRIAVVQNPIAEGIDVNATYPHGNTHHRGPPLWSAVERDYSEIVVLLLAAGADPEVVNCLGECFIQLAKWKGNEEILRLLNRV